jgi:hypothetical protein
MRYRVERPKQVLWIEAKDEKEANAKAKELTNEEWDLEREACNDIPYHLYLEGE